MVYMERGLGCKPLAVAFALCCLGASLGMGNMVQGNAMAKGLEHAFHVPPFVSGVLCTIGVAVVITGGMKRIAGLTEKLVPFMAVLYLGRHRGTFCFSKRDSGSLCIDFFRGLWTAPGSRRRGRLWCGAGCPYGDCQRDFFQ